MKNKIIFVYLCFQFYGFMYGSMHNNFEVHDPRVALMRLRDAQKYASYNEYFLYEQQIRAIKQHENNQQCSRDSIFWQLFLPLFTAIPLIIWQLSLITMFFLLVFRLWYSKLAWLLTGLIFLIIGSWYFYHQKNWDIVTKKRELYIGPGKEYPSRGSCEYLDEIEILAKSGSWKQISRNGLIAWISDD